MKKTTRFLMNCSVLAMIPVFANAAGTYYTGATYQAPQTRYGQSASYTSGNTATPYARPAGYQTSGFSSVRYNNGTVVGQRQTQVQVQNQGASQTSRASSSQKSGDIQNGFYVGGGLSHERGTWKMEMKESSSVLHYDDVAWNVLDLNGKYVFNIGGSTKGQVEAGFKYGMQWGESSMVDDDITNGGFFITQWVETDNAGNVTKVIGDQVGHALSVGTSDGGSMMGFNVGFGLPGVMKWGNLKITPSVGYRYLKYKLETKKNYGLSVDTAACFTVPGSDEIQCDPIVTLYNTDGGTSQVVWRDDIEGKMEISQDYRYIDTAGTYYYQQPGTSHSYEVAWSGPYLALDMLYDINANNSVDARVEIGLPGYSAEGDQPYRFDWQHPKSVSDSASMFGAFHLGLAANWSTAITNSVSLSLGVTYDYYHVGSADAETYLNSTYYTNTYNKLLAQWERWAQDEGHEVADAEKYMLGQIAGVSGDPTAISIKELEKTCSGWVCKASGEIESFYRSLGVRVGVSARF